MPPQWTDRLLQITLRGGSVYYFQERSLTSPQPHYFVVLNLDPLGDEFLILLIASSKVDEVKRRNRHLPSSTLVEIDPTDYSDFSLPTIVDCNRWFRVTKQELLQKLQRQEAREKAPMPGVLMKRLRGGILDSPLVEEAVKNKLRVIDI